VVGVAPEQLPDTACLPVGETERTVERLFCDLRQRLQSSVDARRAKWLPALPPGAGTGVSTAQSTARSPVSLRAVSRYPLMLAVLGASWGASYLFIKVGVRDLSPAVLIEIRLLCAVPVLVVFAWRRYGPAALVAARRQAVVLGVLNAAVPFTLIAWGEKRVDSGTAAVANSSVPIFVALIALRFVPSERSTGLRLVGVVLGLAGVGVLAGVHPPGGPRGAVGTGAIVLASVSYAAANLYAGRHMSLGGSVLAATSMAAALVLLLPLALATLPTHAPGWKPVASAVALGLLGTAFAQILAYRLIRLYGSARAVLVAYLLPAFALLYGALFLSEPLTLQKLAGLGLILGGVALGAGAVRLFRRGTVSQAP
jgi:drug/metabolite transporter (DMT)-like permease